MPTVETTTWIDAPLERVYSIAKRNEDFPNFMKDVLSLTVVEREGTKTVSDWVGLVSAFGLKVRWRQEDDWDDDGHECRFRQLKGDYDKLEGTWSFKDENGGTRFDSVVDYEYNVPTIGALVKKVIHGLVVKNLEDTLAAIKDRAEHKQ
ncbi:MAG: SRPBCC family protein [Armatimonadetes bacterium]|nr:SRPBCC family protein [Armatimonadota bacterium]